jgi:Flp pilus assembly protein TadD
MRRSILVLCVGLVLCGCHLRRRGNAALARRQTATGKDLLKVGKLPEAEEALKAALAADLFHGPAHNNLGIVYYRQKRFYLAAWEFQYAAKLMQNRPEPRNNLGMVFEAVGKLDDAAKCYAEAMDMEPDNPEFIGNLARCRIRQSRRDAETRRLLEQLLLKDTRADWLEWANMELVKMGAASPAPVTTQPAGDPGQPAGSPSQ